MPIRLVFLLGLGGLACQRRDSVPRHGGPEQIESLFLSPTSVLERRERLVIRDSAGWESMWRRLTAMQGQPAGVPPVGFESSLVVVVSAGATGSGHSIRIDSVRASEKDLMIYVRETKIEICNQSDMSMKYPAHAVQVQGLVESVRFVEDSTVQRCPG